MRIESFYQVHEKNAIPLILVSKSQWQNKTLIAAELEQDYLDHQHFKGRLGEKGLIYSTQGLLIKAYIGSGEGEDELAMAYAATLLPAGNYYVQQEISTFAEINWSLAQYRFDRYKKQETEPRVLVVNTENLAAIKLQVSAIFLIRDLINTPTNDMGPQQLAAEVAKLATNFQGKFKQWVGQELLTANFPAIHAVGRASASEPRLLNLTWGEPHHPLIILIGKGVCFDSGGLDIKPYSAMRLMKKDMGGAAQVLGLAQWIMTAGLPIRLEVFIPAVENAIGPDAFRPGDILTMRNGLTVEIDNTDAEGRLILADALVKADELTPELIINFATLTGAARVAVGTEIAAMFTADEELAQELIEASQQVKDPIWRLPLFKSYESMLDSSIADLANASASPYAGAITAALFLQRFVSAKTSWVHFDVMSWNIANKAGKPEGGEAMAIRAVAHYLTKRYANH